MRGLSLVALPLLLTAVFGGLAFNDPVESSSVGAVAKGSIGKRDSNAAGAPGSDLFKGYGPKLTAADEQSALGSALDSDGRLRADARGSFSTEGFDFTTDPDGRPRFMPSDKNKKRKLDNPQGGPEVKDLHWDRRSSHQFGTDGTVYAITRSGSDVYIGGDFNNVDSGRQISRIAKWDGLDWSPLGTASNFIGTVFSIAVSGSSVYVGADNGLFMWNGITWQTLSASSSMVKAVTVSGSSVFFGGDYIPIEIDGQTVSVNVARYNVMTGQTTALTEAVSLETGPNSSVYSLAMVGDRLFAGGDFSWIDINGEVTGDSSPASRIAVWNETLQTWSAVNGGVNGSVDAMAVHGTNLYIGGSFDTANPGSVFSPYLIKLDTASMVWSAPPGGPNNSVRSLSVAGDELYFGGDFDRVYTDTNRNQFGRLDNAMKVAKFDISSSQWHEIGFVVGNTVHALSATTTDPNIFVGGDFTYLGRDVETYSGAATSNFGSLLSPVLVRTIAIFGNNLYAGGLFERFGGVEAKNIIKFDGTSWSELGTGANGPVRTIAVDSSGRVYAGGSFTEIGGVQANNIAMWDGLSWNALGDGITGQFSQTAVNAIAIAPNWDVYVGGDFRTAGSTPADGVAKWDGTAWSALDSGRDSAVFALAFHSGVLYVGGEFGNDPGKALAKWDGTAWSAVIDESNGGLSNAVRALVVKGNDLYVGGIFSAYNNVNVSPVFKVDLAASVPAHVDLNAVDLADVYAMTASNDYLYVAGHDAFSVNRIRQFNFSMPSWSEISNPDPVVGGGRILAMGIRDSELFFGGYFNMAADLPMDGFTRYIQNRFNGLSNSDWGSPSNWQTGLVPISTTNAVIGGENVTMSANGHVKDLQISRGYSLTIPAGVTLFVHGTLILDGDILGDGLVHIVSSDPNAVVKVGPGSIHGALSRQVDTNGPHVFHVGTTNGYSPVIIDTQVGGRRLRVKAYEGPYTANATGLKANRLARWWRVEEELADLCGSPCAADSPQGMAFSADIEFKLRPEDASFGTVAGYRIFRIAGGVANETLGTIDFLKSSFTVTGVTQFSDWTIGQLQGATIPITATVAITNKQYDGNTSATINGCTLSGVSPGDDVACAYGSATASFADKNVGTGKSVSVSGLTLTGANAADYSISGVTASGNITAKPLTISAPTISKTKEYDGTTTVGLIPTVSGYSFIGYDFAAIDGNNGANWPGTSSQELSKSAYPSLSNQEFLELGHVLMNQTPGIGAFVVRYTDNTQTTIDFIRSKASALGLYDRSLTSADPTNTGQQVYLKASEVAGAQAILGSTRGAPQTWTSSNVSGVLTGEAVTVAASVAYATPGAGTGKTITVTYTLSGDLSGNYSVSPLVYNDGVITAKQLSINSQAKSKFSSMPEPTFTYTLSGFITDENAGNVTITGTPSCTRPAGETPGTYGITCTAGTLSTDNYSFVTGTVADLTITYAQYGDLLNTNVGSNIARAFNDSTFGVATVTFANVGTAGDTTIEHVPLSDPGRQTPPNGVNTGITELHFNVTTTAVRSGSVTVCVQAPSANYPGATYTPRLYHYNGSTWSALLSTYNSGSGQLCGQATGVGYFLAGIPLRPTAARAEIGGKIGDGAGRGVSGARVRIIDTESGETKIGSSNQFGRYLFTGLEVGRIYVISVTARGVEGPLSREIMLTGSLTDVDFGMTVRRTGIQPRKKGKSMGQ